MREVSLETLPNVNIRDPSHDKNLPIMSVTGSINQNVFKIQYSYLFVFLKNSSLRSCFYLFHKKFIFPFALRKAITSKCGETGLSKRVLIQDL